MTEANQEPQISQISHSTNKLSIPQRPRRLILEISRNCNLHCRMCGFGGHPIDPKWFMGEEVISHLFDPKNKDFLREVDEIRLNGRGESTIYPNFISVLHRIAESFPNARLTLFTNLMAANNQILNAFNEYGVEIYVSMDSANSKIFETIRKGAKYEIVVNRLKSLKNGFLVFTLQNGNFNEVEGFGQFAAENNFGLILNILRTDDPNEKAEFNALLDSEWDNLMIQFKKLHEYVPRNKLLIPDQIWGREVSESIATAISCDRLPSCPNILSEMMIAFDGTIYPCNMFNSECYGSIQKTALPEIWGSKRHQSFLLAHKIHDYCQHCEYMIPK